MAVGLVALVASLLMRTQIGFPGAIEWLTPDRYYQAVTMHGMIMVIYLLTAFLLGSFGNYLIPLMIGAPETWCFRSSTCSATTSICFPSSF